MRTYRDENDKISPVFFHLLCGTCRPTHEKNAVPLTVAEIRELSTPDLKIITTGKEGRKEEGKEARHNLFLNPFSLSINVLHLHLPKFYTTLF